MAPTPRLNEQLRVRVHQWASGLDPDANRARLAEVPATGEEAVDVDSWADLRDLRR